MLSCKCLNVIIESETNDFQTVELDSLNLADCEKRDNFFLKEIQQVSKLININKVHSGLIQTRNVGSWTINQCINCNVDSHAIHQLWGASCVLVAADLLQFPSIQELQSSELYSPTFNVIVSPFEDDRPIDDIPSELQSTCQGLRHIISEALRKEAAATEERIRRFTDEQHQALEVLRERVFREHKALVGTLVKNHSKRLKSTNTTSGMSSSTPNKSENIPFSSPTSVSGRKGKSNQIANSPGKVKKSPAKSPRSYRAQVSLDAEGLFDFEEIDEMNSSYYNSDFDESDTEDAKEEKVNVSRSRSKSNLAKSLPMNIPVFMSSFHHHIKEDQDDILPPTEDPLDIAASIKALAKSVHGDAVFGELPRPRFSTQM